VTPLQANGLSTRRASEASEISTDITTTDRFGGRMVFYVTLIAYLLGVLSTAVSWNFVSFALFRALTAFGIGGEYAAINSQLMS
jgi:MFS family permease